MIPWVRVAMIVGAVLLVSAALGGIHHHGYKSGVQATKEKWDAEKAQLINDAAKLKAQQEAEWQEKERVNQAEIERLRSLPPKIQHDRVVQYVRGVCSAISGHPSGVPAGTAGNTGRPAANSTVRPDDGPDLDAAAWDIQANVANAQINRQTQLKCRDFVLTHGGRKP